MGGLCVKCGRPVSSEGTVRDNDEFTAWVIDVLDEAGRYEYEPAVYLAIATPEGWMCYPHAMQHYPELCRPTPER